MPKLDRNRVGSIRIILAAALCLWCGPTVAGQWVSSFTVTRLFVAGENNFQYRVYGMPALPACASGPDWAYVNDADSGAKGKVATLLGAFYSGRRVGIFVEVVNGYCHILDLIVE